MLRSPFVIGSLPAIGHRLTLGQAFCILAQLDLRPVIVVIEPLSGKLLVL
nr:hypothetical protein [Enterobacter roggenkampii]